MKKNQKKLIRSLIFFALALVCVLVSRLLPEEVVPQTYEPATTVFVPSEEQLPPCAPELSGITIPEYAGEPWAAVNGGEPLFDSRQLVTESYEHYEALDELGRCTYTMACIGRDIMPTEERGSISSVKPTGWVQNFYENVDGEALYNRAHLIGFQLTGENANRQNLITGTRYFNVEGMLPFENMVADYLYEFKDNHVLYRVTPVFQGDDLVARGVLMEAQSVEDGGEGLCYCVFVYNVQPGIVIDYATGENYAQ